MNGRYSRTVASGTEPARDVSRESRRGWKLFHYISGGGMRTFGRTVQQEELNARQNRFLAAAGIAAALWLALLLW